MHWSTRRYKYAVKHVVDAVFPIHKEHEMSVSLVGSYCGSGCTLLHCIMRIKYACCMRSMVNV
jgi:hypothetical protein